jgi:peptidoglycan/xylan/chitin deacetylase (PgdA/CDA1 family)
MEHFPELVAQTKTQGHLIASHGYEHLNGWHTSNKKYIENVHASNHLHNNTFFRPPYGKLSLKQYLSLKKTHKIILWDVMGYDFDSTRTPEVLYRKITQKIRPGSIIVLHENDKSLKNLQYLLPKLLGEYSKKGYEFSSL